MICGDNCSILPNGLNTNPLDRTLTGPTIYTAVLNPDGSSTYLPAIQSSPALDPTGQLERTIVLFDGGTTNATLYGNDVIAGGAGNDEIFGEMGNDVIQGDGSVTLERRHLRDPGHLGRRLRRAGHRRQRLHRGRRRQRPHLRRTRPGRHRRRQLRPLRLHHAAQRPDGVDEIFGDTGTAIGLNDPGDTSANGHSHDADVILGDNGDIYRLVGANGQFLTYNYDNYAGETEHIIPTAIKLIDYSPYGDSSYTTCDSTDPDNCWTVTTTHPANIGGGDILHGEAGNDVVYGETGADTIFGDGQDDQLYGNSGNDWIVGRHRRRRHARRRRPARAGSRTRSPSRCSGSPRRRS